ncbi:prepilin-type N-terminal cleavage/methylation domain-containing protein [Kiloniella majae]|uniref:prepilin-type N-terminal cleavage/methylation domain-containing protein n=1 Tax=Kiloniella majae TaxID=1938558 RepID=UPI000A277E17|nr:prepilin-type N-terminal cleavage/methylation domain-containing protein [Kiloniella majae]
MSKNRTYRQKQAGFTLVELLIVLVLVGIIALGLLGGLQFSYKTWDRGRDRSNNFNQVITLQELLRKQAKAFPVERNLSSDVRSLEGESDRLRLISSYPSFLSEEGLNQFSYYSDGEHILMDWQSASSKGDVQASLDDTGLGDTGKETRLMLENVSRITFSYYGFPLSGGGRKWLNRWEDRTDLPELIRVKVDFVKNTTQLQWPELTIQPLVQGGNKIY